MIFNDISWLLKLDYMEQNLMFLFLFWLYAIIIVSNYVHIWCYYFKPIDETSEFQFFLMTINASIAQILGLKTFALKISRLDDLKP